MAPLQCSSFSVAHFNLTFFLFFMIVVAVVAEKHTITFDNRCGHGTPQLIQQGNVLSKGEPFTSNGPFISGIAYLQTGACLLNGEGCTLVEMTLVNPKCVGCGSSTDISLIPPHAYSVPVSFSYYGGCNGQGAICSSPTCNTAFFVPDDNQVQVECQHEDVNLLITFCAGDASGPGNPSDKSSVMPASTIVLQHASGGVSASTATKKSVQASSTSTPSASLGGLSATPNAPQCAVNGRRRNRRRSLSLAVPLGLGEHSVRRTSRAHGHRHTRRKL